MMLRNFAIDLTVLPNSLGGIPLYAIHLATHLEKVFDCVVLTPDYHADRFERPVVCPDPVVIRRGLVSRNPFWQRHLGVRIDESTLIYAPHMHGLIGHRRQIITIHDLIAPHHPTRNVIENAFHAWAVPIIARRCSGIITVSETSRAGIAEFYGVDPQKISVVHNGLDLTQWKPAQAPARAAEPNYLLVVGANRPYKNALELLQYHDLWAGRYRVKIIAGNTRYGRELRRYVAEQRLDPFVDFLDALDEADLIALYQHCAAVVFPSLEEGFGRPPLEAMAVGRPVILSDIAVHREFFSSAGIFVRPGQRADWETAFHTLDDQPKLEALATAGQRVAQDFPLDRAGRELEAALLRFEPDLAELRWDRHGRRVPQMAADEAQGGHAAA